MSAGLPSRHPPIHETLVSHPPTLVARAQQPFSAERALIACQGRRIASLADVNRMPGGPRATGRFMAAGVALFTCPIKVDLCSTAGRRQLRANQTPASADVS